MATSAITMIRKASVVHHHGDAQTIIVTFTGEQAVKEDIITVVSKLMKAIGSQG